MKNRQPNLAKTVDTDKNTASNRTSGPDFKFKFNENPQINKKNQHPQEEEKKIDTLIEPVYPKKEATLSEKKKATGIYCIGDLPFFLFFHCQKKNWRKIDFSEKSLFKGDLKYPSIIRLNKSDTIILSGGCDNYTGEASDSVFTANIPNIDIFQKINSMKN